MKIGIRKFIEKSLKRDLLAAQTTHLLCDFLEPKQNYYDLMTALLNLYRDIIEEKALADELSAYVHDIIFCLRHMGGTTS